MNDAEAFDYYDDQAKREPTAAEPRRRPDRLLTQHVPVRFPSETIRRVESLAEVDGMTVGAWIRRVVDETLRRPESLGPTPR
jgi:hypothetical protein